MPPKIAVITGPTATGKTGLGVCLALELGGEVVGADSMQIYRGMDIGTAKPTAGEMRGVPHHMIDVASPFESWSVSRYVEQAARCTDDILARGKLPIVVGGTGLWIDSLVRGLSFAPPSDAELRLELGGRYDEIGGEAMLLELSRFDPDSAARLHANDKKRIVRAFEVYRLTGVGISEHDRQSRLRPPRYEACRIILDFARREDLYSRCDRRVDLMMEQGLEAEVRALLDMGLDSGHTAMQAIGYKEIARALQSGGDMAEAVEDIKRETRRYAKRQLSWLSRDRQGLRLRWEKEPDMDTGLHASTEFLANNGVI